MLLLYPNMVNLDNHTQSDVFVSYKKEGETPLECLNRLKDEGFLPYDSKFTYAGRLDPMAEGVMVFLRGEAIKEKDHFLHLDKEYEVEILLGASTDTGDILGLINEAKKTEVSFDIKNINKILESFVGEMEVPYPWFSSKVVNGKPLHEWIREFASEDSSSEETDIDSVNDKKELFTRPLTKLSIKDIELLDFSLISNVDLINNVVQRISKVKGDFRQDQILHEWDKISINKISRKAKVLNHDSDMEYPLIKIRVKCKGGSYMRTLAELIGEKLNVPALAYSIKRLAVGDYRS